jgi:hypothetical protein
VKDQAEICWPGTDDERMALIKACNRQCGCEKPMGYTTIQRGCHDLLTPDYKVWSHLVFGRRRAGTLLVQELGPQHRAIPLPPYTLHLVGLIHALGRK